jgi:hypothetical protein
MAEESTAEDSDSQFKDIVRDLFNIEVNTILRDKISAQKMPGFRNALMDIGVEYFEVLEKAETTYRGKYPPDEHPDKYPDNDKNGWSSWRVRDIPRSLGFYTEDEYAKAQQGLAGITDEFMIVDPLVCDQLGGFEAFAIMRRWADKFLQDPEFLEDLRSADDLEGRNLDEKKRILSVLPRIKENADMLKGMFSRICLRELDKDHKGELTKELKKIRPSELTSETVVQESRKIDPEQTRSLTNQYTRSEVVSLSESLSPLMKQGEMVLVRKIWEVGTEVIAMQTTIQVDGDVITRLNPNYLDEKVYEKLSDYHKNGVNMALSYWANLVGIAQGLLSRLTGR